MSDLICNVVITAPSSSVHKMLDRLEDETIPFEGVISKVQRGIFRLTIRTDFTNMEYFTKKLTVK